ncbi:MAG: hypothetical protein JSW71_09095 [Gemmatimonadota bacterium]|nr:MAG: hypothetical protein JSW71_09095 [Gemmatimonadota bacterium]
MRLAAWYILGLATAHTGALTAQAPDTLGQPLFESHEILQLTIQAPFKTIFKDRDQESEEHPGTLSYVDPDGTRVNLEVKVRTRGKFRLQRSTCDFPNVRVNFKKKQVQNTIFHNQDKLKLVGHCQNNREEYEQQTLLEYLVYRSLNLFTDLSFRVRLAQITYIDTEEDDDPLTRYAFFIEDEDLMAARNGWQVLEAPGIPPQEYEAADLTLVELFQFMMGNTDWDAFKTPPDEEYCCHNLIPVGSTLKPVYPVPYDFDWAGVVDARYAKPDQSLRIRSVRDRLYRGICRPPDDFGVLLESAVRQFRDNKDAIYALFQNQEGLEQKYIDRNIEYFDEFYEIVNDVPKANREIVERCRRW